MDIELLLFWLLSSSSGAANISAFALFNHSSTFTTTSNTNQLDIWYSNIHCSHIILVCNIHCNHIILVCNIHCSLLFWYSNIRFSQIILVWNIHCNHIILVCSVTSLFKAIFVQNYPSILLCELGCLQNASPPTFSTLDGTGFVHSHTSVLLEDRIFNRCILSVQIISYFTLHFMNINSLQHISIILSWLHFVNINDYTCTYLHLSVKFLF